jgi:hypothetical protein
MDNALAASRPAACEDVSGRTSAIHETRPLKRKHCLFDDVPIHRYLLEGTRSFNPSDGLFDGRRQRVVIGVEYEDSEQLCGLGLARVAADRMDIARPFGPALACPIDARLAVIHLRLDRARNHIGIDESRLRVCVGYGGRAGRVSDFHGDQRLARDIGNGRLEVFRDGLRFAIMGVDEAGHREGKGGAGGGDDGSDLQGLSPSA